MQAFPIANHAVAPDADFKLIYGVEAYLVDDLKNTPRHRLFNNIPDIGYAVHIAHFRMAVQFHTLF